MIILTLFQLTGNNKDFAIEEKSKKEGINGDKNLQLK